ncbi:MAG: hypothetical protein Q8Q06_03605 [bacterium]|nr:hypothetical protein [bacterium]
MYKEYSEKGSAVAVEDAPEKNSYQRYLELGGIINKKDYASALERAKNITAPDNTLIMQADSIAKFAGIKLSGPLDKITILYGILRKDVQPKEAEYHHRQMSDQRIFVEALRMLGDTESLDKMIKAYPNISFEYQREDDN